MIYSLKAPDHIEATIQLPASKSISNRILLLNKLSENPCPITNLSECDDTRAMISAFESSKKEINVGAAGTAMRFLTAYFTTQTGSYLLTGSERNKNRPIGVLVNALRKLGAEIDYIEKENYPPLRIHGKELEGGEIEIDSSISSQYISALLMIAPRMKKGLILHLQGEQISAPYMQMTISLMREFGITIQQQKNDLIVPTGSYKSLSFHVENDWSAASYWYEIVALGGGEVTLPGLNRNSMQGDVRVRELFEPLGVETLYMSDGIKIKKRESVSLPSRLDYDLIDQPDLTQTLVVTCCLLDIPFLFKGLQSLQIKETNRIDALRKEVKKLGYVLETTSETIAWQGEKMKPEESPVIKTYEDHRMAMAFAPASIKKETIKIEHPEVVSKSYPCFWEDLVAAGFYIGKE